MTERDTYRTIEKPSEEILYKEKHSKFFGYAFPVTSEDEVKAHIEALRKQHRGAVHFCYAWQMGTEKTSSRANDDGEPTNSAGMPILGQIQHFKVTNVLVVIVRFFGGIKLGVGGLMSAYKIAAQMALDASEIVEKTIETEFVVHFGYPDMNKVMRIVRERNLSILSQEMGMDCKMVLSSRRRDAAKVEEAFEPLYEVKLEKLAK